MLRSVSEARPQPPVGRASDIKITVKSLQKYAVICRVELCAKISQHHQNQVSTICTAENIIEYARKQLSRYCAQVCMQTEICEEDCAPLTEQQRHVPTALMYRVDLTPVCRVWEGLNLIQAFPGEVL